MALMLQSLLRTVRQRGTTAIIPRSSNIISRQNYATNTTDANAATAPSSSQADDASGNVKANAGKQKLMVSDSCLKRLREITDSGRSFLRITVEGGGCSGFQYKFDLDSKLNDDDVVFGEADAKVVIDNISLEYCAGATVDYHTELIRAGFRILANPQAEQGCSCGASFAIKLD